MGRRIWAAVFGASLACALPASAQEQAAEAQEARKIVQSRFLGDWAYLPVAAVPGPFLTSSASSVTGLGGYELDVELQLPSLILPRQRGLDYQAVLQRFDLQLAFLDRFAIQVNAQGEGVIPDTKRSALALSVNGTWGAGGGLLAGLFHDDRMQLSLFADYSFLERRLVSPAGAFANTGQAINFRRLLNRQDVHQFEIGPSFALALSGWFGVVAEAAWESRWQSEDFLNRDENINFVDLRGAASANFWQSKVPIGFSAFWRQQIPVGGDNPFDYQRQFGGAIFYTGRPWLDVGMEIFREQSQQQPGRTLRRIERDYLAPRIRGYF